MSEIQCNFHSDLLNLWAQENHKDYVCVRDLNLYLMDFRFFEIYHAVEGVRKMLEDATYYVGLQGMGAIIHLISTLESISSDFTGYEYSQETTFCDQHPLEWARIAEMAQDCLELAEDMYRHCNDDTPDYWATNLEDYISDEIPKYRKEKEDHWYSSFLSDKRGLQNFPSPIAELSGARIKYIQKMQDRMTLLFEENKAELLQLLSIQLTRLHRMALSQVPPSTFIYMESIDTEAQRIEKCLNDNYNEYLVDLRQGGTIDIDYRKMLDYRFRGLGDEDRLEALKSELRAQEGKMEKLLECLDAKYTGDLTEAGLRIHSYFNNSQSAHAFLAEEVSKLPCSDADITPFQICMVMYFGIRQRIDIVQELMDMCEPQPVDTPSRKILEYIYDRKSAERLVKNMEYLIRGRKGKDVALIIETAVKKGLMRKPPFSVIEEEFPNIGSSSAFNKYYDKGLFHEDEISRTYQFLIIE